MAKVIQAFRERYHSMKLYKVGDEYPEDDMERVHYLASQGYLETEPLKADTTSLTLEGFSELSAADQKKVIADLGIEGDDGNAEKRIELYAAYLASVDNNGNPDA